MAASLDLWVIGNCQVSALIDRAGRFVWACVPRVDGDPLFSALLSGPQADHAAKGFWSVELEDCASIRQRYRRNTPVLVSLHSDSHGNAMEVIDFCPRVQRLDRVYRPTAFARIVRPVSGVPRIRVRLRPTYAFGEHAATRTFGSNHIRYVLDHSSYRLTTDSPVSLIGDELAFRLEKALHFFLGPDEPFASELATSRPDAGGHDVRMADLGPGAGDAT